MDSMGYAKTFNSDKSLLPDIVHHFKQIPEAYIHGQNHDQPMRHPGAIFNISFREVNIAIASTLDALDEYIKDIKNEEKRDRLLLFKKILYNEICSFYDECYMILIALCPPAPIKGGFAYEWLQQNGYKSGDTFKSSSADLVKRYQMINNRLKHNNQRLSALSVTIRDLNIVIPSFYVEGVERGGTICPDVTIHQPFNGVSSAISFNYSIRMIFYLVYILSDKLLDTIKKDLKNRHAFKFPAKAYVKHDALTESNWIRICNLPSYFLPNEYGMDLPLAERQNNLFKLIYPRTLSAPLGSGMLSLSGYTTGDGYSKSFGFPYSKVEKQQ